MSRIRFLFASAALILATLALAACGGGGGNGDADPVSVLDEATLEGIESADLEAKIAILTSGAEGGEVDLTLSGPFESVEGGSTPKLDMAMTVSGTMDGENIDFEGGLVLLPNSAYVGYQGTDYEVDPTTFSFVESALKQAQQQGQSESEGLGLSACRKAAAKLDVGDFIEGAKNEGEADVGGTSTTKVSGELNYDVAIDTALKLYADPACSSQLQATGERLPSLGRLRKSRSEVREAVKEARVDVYVGDDDIIRRVAGELILKQKETAKVNFDLTLDGVNEEQEISAPATARPLNDLFAKLGVNPLELLGALQGEGDGLGDLLEGIEAESARGL